MKKLILLCVGSLFCLSLSAQIKFDKLEHDFGVINEGDLSTFKFTFKNVGKNTATLKEVKASCGCTTPQYTRKTLSPSDTGSIMVSYNSKGRPGMFTKTVTVIYDTTQAPIILTIKGDVKSAPSAPNQPNHNHNHNHDGHNHDGHNHDGHDHHNHTQSNTGGNNNTTQLNGAQLAIAKPANGQSRMEVVPLGSGNNPNQKNSPVTEIKQATSGNLEGTNLPAHKRPSITFYPDTVGALAFNNMHQLAQTLKSDEDKEYTIDIRNVSPNVVKLLDKVDAKPYFKLTMTEKTLNPGQSTTLKLKFIAAQAKDITPSFKEVTSFYTDEKENAKKNLIVEGVFQKKMTAEEMANAPKINFAAADFDAGEILAGEELVHKYTFTNTGKTDLVIESAKASCGCTVPELKEKVIKPGMTSYIEAKFNSAGRSGFQHKTITVVSNDPNNPRITLNLKCTVKEDPFGGGTEEKKLPLNDNSRMGGNY